MDYNFNQSDSVWDKFIKTSRHSSIFVTSSFIKSLNIPYKFITASDGNEIVAGMPLFFNSDGSLNLSRQLFTQYQGILLKDFTYLITHKKTSKNYNILTDFLDVIYAKYNCLSCSQHYNFEDLRPFQWLNYGNNDLPHFNFSIRYTALLDLTEFSSFEEFYKKLPLKRRKNKSQVLSYRVVENPHILNQMLDKTFERQAIIRDTFDRDRTLSITQSAINGGYGRVGVAELNGNVIAANLFLFYNDCAYYLFGGANPEYYNYDAANFLMLNTIKDCFISNYKFVDFVGANSPQRGSVKLSYNAELKPYIECYLK